MLTHEQIDTLTLETYPYPNTGEDNQAVKNAWLVFEKLRLHEELDDKTEAEQEAVRRESLNERFLTLFKLDNGLPWRQGLIDDINPAGWWHDNYLTHNEADLLNIVATMEARKEVWLVEQNVKKEIEIGEQVSRLCETAYNAVIGHNINSGLTIEQIDALDLEFGDIKKALQDKRPDKAKALIASVVDHDILKDKLLAILDY